jgi:hypothetical protein
MAKTPEQLGGDETLLQEVVDIFSKRLRNISRSGVLQWHKG